MAALDVEGEPETRISFTETDESQLQRILAKHDKGGKLTRQVSQCLTSDSITWDLLCGFDDESLTKTIRSWHFNHDKPFIIHGVLIAAVKKMRSKDNINVSRVVSEPEMKSFDLLNDYEKFINDMIETTQSEITLNDQFQQLNQTKQKAEIEAIFTKLSDKLLDQKSKLVSELDASYKHSCEKYKSYKEDYITSLNAIKSQISDTARIYHANIEKYTINSDRAKTNCNMIQNTLQKCKQTHADWVQSHPLVGSASGAPDASSDASKSDTMSITWDRSLISNIESLIDQLGSMQLVSNDLDTEIIDKIGKNDVVQLPPRAHVARAPMTYSALTLSSDTVWDSDAVYEFSTLTLGQDVTLTVTAWDECSGKGGILRIRCESMLLKSGSKIDLSGKGYKGGRKRCYQGYSYNNAQISKNVENIENVENFDNIDNADIASGSKLKNMRKMSDVSDGSVDSVNCKINKKAKDYKRKASANVSGRKGTDSSLLALASAPVVSNECNFGGGGGGSNRSALWAGAGGGGGFGTAGTPGQGYGGFGSGKAGVCYGNERLEPMYLGSGGGGTFEFNGTSGGGAIVIECLNELVIEKNAIICANGGNINEAENKWSGCGSGGAIYLKAPKIVNNGKISAVGGRNVANRKDSKSGKGGVGRIRIDCKQQNLQYLKAQAGSSFLGGLLQGSASIKPNVGSLNFL